MAACGNEGGILAVLWKWRRIAGCTVGVRMNCWLHVEMKEEYWLHVEMKKDCWLYCGNEEGLLAELEK